MAIENNNQSSSSSTRRLFFGTNIAIAVLLFAAVLLGVNWIAQENNYRADLAGGLASHALSERTEKLLDKAGAEFEITTVYTSDKPDTNREKYLPKLRDYLTEVEQYNDKIKVRHLHSGNEVARLRDNILQTFATSTGDYQETIDQAEATWKSLSKQLQRLQSTTQSLLQTDSWLADFPMLANLNANLRNDIKKIEQTRNEVDELIHAQSMPRYEEANNKIEETNKTIRNHLQSARKWITGINKLVAGLSAPQSEFVQTTREKAAQLIEKALELQQVSGKPEEQAVPDDPRPVIRKFATEAEKLATLLMTEAERVEEFVQKYPAIEYLPQWEIRQQIFVMQLPAILSQSASDLDNSSQTLRSYVANENVALDQLQNLVRQMRQLAADRLDMIKLWTQQVNLIFDQIQKIDQPSQQFLSTTDEQVLTPVLEQLQQLKDKIENLPELKLDEIARRLEKENIVVLQRKDQIKVVPFNDVWPVADPLPGRMTMGMEKRRIFDGDTAIGDAMLSMLNEKPFATVILTVFETMPPQQMRQLGMRRRTGPIPLTSTSILQEKLEKANFIVKEWNLGAEGEQAEHPELTEDTQLSKPIYIFLPPAPDARQNPFMRQMPLESFGPEQMARIREALADGSRSIFLTSYNFRQDYQYKQFLKNEWGIDVLDDYRVIHGVVDKDNPSRFHISFRRWNYMQISHFTDQVIGEPFRARRMLMWEVCPIQSADEVPESVNIEPILQVPDQPDIWAEGNIRPIIEAFLTGEQNSTFTRSEESKDPPFPVMVAAKNSQTDARTVVLGNGMCYRDDYLERRVMDTQGEDQVVVTAPPPTENVELLTNAVYWLCGPKGEELIASGPAEVPRVPAIDKENKRQLWAIATIWAFVILIVGGIVMMIRRR
jgi:hypothetical protein